MPRGGQNGICSGSSFWLSPLISPPRAMILTNFKPRLLFLIFHLSTVINSRLNNKQLNCKSSYSGRQKQVKRKKPSSTMIVATSTCPSSLVALSNSPNLHGTNAYPASARIRHSLELSPDYNFWPLATTLADELSHIPRHSCPRSIGRSKDCCLIRSARHPPSHEDQPLNFQLHHI